MYKLWKDFMTFAYYRGGRAVEGFRLMHAKGQRRRKNAWRELEGIIYSEFYKKVEFAMQDQRSTLDTIIIDHTVMIDLHDPHHGE